MSVLFWAYFCGFLALGVAGLYDSVRSPRGFVLVLLEGSALVAVVGGMLMFWSGGFADLRDVWKAAFFFIVLVELAVALADLRELRADAALSPWQRAASVAAAFLFTVPGLWMNWQVAFAATPVR